jgi:hypothetical protein
MCFSLGWLQQILIWCVIIGAVVAILQIIIPYALQKMGGTISEGAGILIRILKVILWAVVAVFVITVAFELIACLLGSVSLPRLPRG